MQNTLYYGDNLEVLGQYVADASVDLVYLDPPFNSNRDYNVLFKEQSGAESPAQIKAFGDTWNWAGAAEAWSQFPEICPAPKVIELMRGFHNTLGENDVMAYLVMMAPRLWHLHRALKPTGSLYLHCDQTVGHYLKLILDAIFGAKNFRNEIIWKRKTGRGDTGGTSKRFGTVTDIIYFYGKTEATTFHQLYRPNSQEYLDKFFKFVDGNGRRYAADNLASPSPRPNLTYVYKGYQPPSFGWAISQEKMEMWDKQGKLIFPKSPEGRIRRKRYLDELQGEAIQNLWDDISAVSALHAERMGYPTQKPLALLERIINASSNPGDVVLDPFCGCGTAVVAAQKLGRHWLGIDITPIATSLVQKRLYDAFEARDARLLSAAELAQDPQAAVRAFRVEGLPTDEAGARAMYEADHKKFEMWAVGLIPAIPQEKKGADGGIDGLAYFDVGAKELTRAVVQVKGGRNIGSPDVQQLRGAMEKHNAALGFFISLEAPKATMHKEALAAQFYKASTGVGKQVQALQIRTVGQLLTGQGFDFPISHGSNVSYKQAAAIAQAAGQGAMEL